LDAAAELRTFVEEEKQKGTLKLKRVSE